MVNAALGVFLLLFVAPIVVNFGDKPGYVQVALVLCIIPVVLVAALALISAARPGALGRAVRRRRAARRSRS